jgi:hypothetical protein
MTSIYDDPELKGGSDDRLKFTDIGDRVKGRVTHIEKFRGQTVGLKYTLAGVVARQAGQPVQLASGTLICTASKLVAELMDVRPEVGDTLDIQLTNKTPAAVGHLHHFAVNVERASAPAAAPVDPAQPTLADDLFG